MHFSKDVWIFIIVFCFCFLFHAFLFLWLLAWHSFNAHEVSRDWTYCKCMWVSAKCSIYIFYKSIHSVSPVFWHHVFTLRYIILTWKTCVNTGRRLRASFACEGTGVSCHLAVTGLYWEFCCETQNTPAEHLPSTRQDCHRVWILACVYIVSLLANLSFTLWWSTVIDHMSLIAPRL